VVLGLGGVALFGGGAGLMLARSRRSEDADADALGPTGEL
jgi:hypothetical protein